jgi:hypothetical protein
MLASRRAAQRAGLSGALVLEDLTQEQLLRGRAAHSLLLGTAAAVPALQP